MSENSCKYLIVQIIIYIGGNDCSNIRKNQAFIISDKMKEKQNYVVMFVYGLYVDCAPHFTHFK